MMRGVPGSWLRRLIEEASQEERPEVGDQDRARGLFPAVILQVALVLQRGLVQPRARNPTSVQEPAGR